MLQVLQVTRRSKGKSETRRALPVDAAHRTVSINDAYVFLCVFSFSLSLARATDYTSNKWQLEAAAALVQRNLAQSAANEAVLYGQQEASAAPKQEVWFDLIRFDSISESKGSRVTKTIVTQLRWIDRMISLICCPFLYLHY